MDSGKRNAPVINLGMCRCCRSMKKCRLLSHKYVWMGNSEVYSDMLVDCFGLLLSCVDEESTDSGVCATCVVRLRDACSFRIQVLKSEEMFLREKLQVSKVLVKAESPECVHQSDGEDNVSLGFEINMSVEQDSATQASDDKYIHKFNISEEASVFKEEKTVKLKKTRNSIKNICTEDKSLVKRIKNKDGLRVTGNKGKSILLNTQKKNVKKTLMIRRKPISHDQEHMSETNLLTLVENSYVCPFSNRFSSYFCFYCNQTFVKTDELRAHTLTHNVHDYKFIFKRRSHPKLDITKIDCRLCSESINDLETFKSHISVVHNKEYYDIKDPILIFRLTDVNLSCVICNDTFPFFDKLIKHMVVHYSNFTCDVCGEAFLKEINLKNHLTTHDTDKNTCTICDKKFATEQGRELHLNTIHNKSPSIACIKCDALLYTYYDREIHMSEVHGESQKYACSECDKLYDRKRSLSEHCRRVHLKVKRHQCEFCLERFFTPTLLKDHLTTHTGEKNFRCHFCNKSYPRLKTLRQHIRIHTNDRRYKCHICNSAFVQNVSLKCHMKSHHPDFVMEKLS